MWILLRQLEGMQAENCFWHLVQYTKNQTTELLALATQLV